MDGTFKSCPRQFMQMYTIFVDVCGYVFPAIFILMTRRTVPLYTAIFQKLLELFPTFSPTHVMADFESAPITALQSLVQVEASGCWFHYVSANLKKVRKLGLTDEFRNNPAVKKAIKLIMCLPLLDANAILQAYRDIKYSLPFDVLRTLCTWMQR